MIAHPGPGIGFHKRFMWRIIIPPTPSTPDIKEVFNVEEEVEMEPPVIIDAPMLGGVDGQRINTLPGLRGESEICIVYYPASY